MADVVVFVDDAVRGRLPAVCVRDGVPTADRLRVSEEIGGSNPLGVAWLLLLLGPLGWIALLALAVRGSRAELLTVELPLSEPAYERRAAAERTRNAGVVFAVVGGLAMLGLYVWVRLAASGFVLTLGTIAVGLAVTLAGEWRLGRERISVRLDASRRWVTLRGVHPAFAAAVTFDPAAERGPVVR